ncbi:hypothetical protein CDEF62S_03353 [Castellaniella defragrans]
MIADSSHSSAHFTRMPVSRIEFLASKESIAAKFQDVRAFFEGMTRTAMQGEFNVDNLRKMALDGHILIGIIREDDAPVMGLALEFLTFPNYRVMNIIALAGTGLAAAMRDVWPLLTEFARQSGASRIQVSCHPGMARLLSRYGFKETYRVVRADL